MKRLLLAAAIAFAALSCTKEPLELERRAVEGGHLCFEVEEENLDTKSYYSTESSVYAWETDDDIYFVSKRNGTVHQSGVCSVKKNASGSYTISIDAPQPFLAGDVIYAYYSPECDQTAGSTTVQMSIPSDQYSVIDKEKYITTQTVSSGTQTVAFSFSGSLDQTTVSNQTSKTPPARTLTVTIPDYDSSYAYTYSTDNRTYRTLSVGSNGKASISVSFSSISFSGNSGSTSKTVYIKCKSGSAASVTVNVSGTKGGSSYSWWGGGSSKYSYTYSLGNVSSGSYQIPGQTTTSEVTSYSSDKELRARNAMPQVSSAVTVTSSMVSNSASIASALSFKMLGSAVEFRLYSLNNAIGVGETIKSVKLSTASNVISGSFNYNLATNPLTISGLDGNYVNADVEDCGYTVPNSKSNYQSVYMIVAPGTYAATLEITTDSYVYTAQVSTKTYSRASKKAIALDISSSAFTRTPVVTPDEPQDPVDPEEPEEPEQPEEPTDPQDPPVDPTDPQDPVYEWETTYAVFASDRHSNTSAISTAFRNMPSAVPYVCLIGDMEGSRGGDHPAYNSSTIKAEVDAVFSNATTQIFWADHDASVTDNAGIVKGATAGSSSLAYTAYDSHGNVQYYVYNIAFYDMNNASNAQTAAAEFENWVSTVDAGIPVFVACHIPIHAARNDNYGAYYWNRALTYAATGSETGVAANITRNVVFLHGHNHTNESNKEYYYAPGSSISVAKSGGNVTCAIPYTYITGGYLNANKKATLIQVNESNIVFTKYSSGSASQLGSVTRVSR